MSDEFARRRSYVRDVLADLVSTEAVAPDDFFAPIENGGYSTWYDGHIVSIVYEHVTLPGQDELTGDGLTIDVLGPFWNVVHRCVFHNVEGLRAHGSPALELMRLERSKHEDGWACTFKTWDDRIYLAFRYGEVFVERRKLRRPLERETPAHWGENASGSCQE